MSNLPDVGPESAARILRHLHDCQTPRFAGAGGPMTRSQFEQVVLIALAWMVLWPCLARGGRVYVSDPLQQIMSLSVRIAGLSLWQLNKVRVTAADPEADRNRGKSCDDVDRGLYQV